MEGLHSFAEMGRAKVINVRNRSFWLLVIMLALVSVALYLPAPASLSLTRHASERILYLLPITYSGFMFGLRAALASSLFSLLLMLPQALFLSPAPFDSLVETGLVVLIGALVCMWFRAQVKEREERDRALESLREAQGELRSYVERLQSNEKRLSTLYAITSLVTQYLELDEVLNTAIAKVADVMGVEIVLAYLLDWERQELELVAYRGVSEQFAAAVNEMQPGEGFNGRVVATGEPMVVEDASQDPRLSRMVVQQEGLRAQLIVPLRAKGIVVGTLCVATRRLRQFQAEEIDLLSAIANAIDVAIENARLYQTQKQIAEDLRVSERKYRALFEGANDAIWLHDLKGRIIGANKATSELTGYNLDELKDMNVVSLLPEKSLALAREVRRKLLQGQVLEQPYDQRLVRKDGTEASIRLTTNLISADGMPIGFQHIARDVTEERRMQENLRFYLQEVVRAQEEERKRIARELHDDTAQLLSALSRRMDNFGRKNPRLSAEDLTILNDLREQVKAALDGVRRFAQDLRPSTLDDLGLLPTLSWMTSELQSRYGIETELKVLGTQRRFLPEVELLLFRIVQEALNNIGKHAEASKAQVMIEFGENRIRLRVSDDGRGFELPHRVDDFSRLGKLGLLGMEERARLLGGRLKIRSKLGMGTTITLEAPIAERTPATRAEGIAEGSA